MADLSIRIDLVGGGQIGPGKVRLLEAVADTGSISAGGRALGMSYRRAWLLIDEMNTLFDEPVVSASVGGKRGGGASLTPFGHVLVRTYREVQALAHTASRSQLQILEDKAKPRTLE